MYKACISKPAKIMDFAYIFRMEKHLCQIWEIG